MSRWSEHSGGDVEGANLPHGEPYEVPKRTCPTCGEPTGSLPNHLPACDGGDK